ncbi:hypothetical protein [Psychrobacter sp. I-STPA6b]|nr:hypothetical protein [Psychrobacter sp. I-STPA6b]
MLISHDKKIAPVKCKGERVMIAIDQPSMSQQGINPYFDIPLLSSIQTIE